MKDKIESINTILGSALCRLQKLEGHDLGEFEEEMMNLKGTLSCVTYELNKLEGDYHAK